MNEHRLLPTAQVGERLGVCSRTVISLIEKGYIDAIRPAWAYFVTEEALDDYQRRKAAGLVPSVGRPRKPVKKRGDK